MANPSFLADLLISHRLFAVLVGYFILTLGFTLFSLRVSKNHLFRLITLFYLGASLGTSFYLYNQLLSLPKPIDQEFFLRNAKEAVVLGVRAKDDQAIYLWLQLPGLDYPSYYTMPWNGKAAEDLQMAKKEVAEQGGLLLMNTPFQRTPLTGQRADEKEKVFYASPPPRPPVKAGEENAAGPAMVYRPR